MEGKTTKVICRECKKYLRTPKCDIEAETCVHRERTGYDYIKGKSIWKVKTKCCEALNHNGECEYFEPRGFLDKYMDLIVVLITIGLIILGFVL